MWFEEGKVIGPIGKKKIIVRVKAHSQGQKGLKGHTKDLIESQSCHSLRSWSETEVVKGHIFRIRGAKDERV